MSGIWTIIVPEAGTNLVKNPSAELDGNFYPFFFAANYSESLSPSASTSPTTSPSPSVSPSGSVSPSASQSRSPSASQSKSPSASASPSGSASPSSSVSPSPSPSAGLGAISRVTTYARFGDYCYYVQPSGAQDGCRLELSQLANATHYVSLYWYDNLSSGWLEVSLDGNAFHRLTPIGGRDGGWIRGGHEIPAGQASGSTRLYIRCSADEDFYIDGVQVEANSYGTTYIDGDRGDLYRWNGLRHGSSSTRSAQERRGGRERNLLDDYGVEVVEGTKRIGTPPLLHNLQSQSLLPGARYQGVKVLPREVELHLNYSAESWAGFHAKRNDVIDLLKPDLVRGSQPIVIGYAGPGTDKKVYAEFYYNGGMEFGDFLAYDEIAPVRLLAPDPFWTADDQETAVLDYQDSVASAAYVLGRISGQWRALASGMNGMVRAVAVDKQRNRIYFGGSFTSPANRICYWDGNQFVPMAGGVTGGAGGGVYAIAIAPSGDVWIGGDFTSVNGVANNYVARWNIATSTWTGFGTTIPTDAVRAIAIRPSNGNVYLGGVFLNWDANANADYIVYYDGSAWNNLGTPPLTDTISNHSIAFDHDENLIVGAGDGVLRKWDHSAWTTLTTVTGGATDIFGVEVKQDGGILVTGNFTSPGNNIFLWNGSAGLALGDGVNGSCFGTHRAEDGLMIAFGAFTSAGGLALADRIALWNGTSWTHLDVDLPGSAVVQSAIFVGQDIYAGYDTSGAATAAGLTSASNGGSTAAYPRLSVINGNSSGSCTLQWLENQSSDHRMYFNLVLQAGESVSLDLTNAQKRLVSDWRGLITDNPLKNSDVVNWLLLPGANTIATFITGTVTSVVALLHWTPRYWSADGAA